MNARLAVINDQTIFTYPLMTVTKCNECIEELSNVGMVLASFKNVRCGEEVL